MQLPDPIPFNPHLCGHTDRTTKSAAVASAPVAAAAMDPFFLTFLYTDDQPLAVVRDMTLLYQLHDIADVLMYIRSLNQMIIEQMAQYSPSLYIGDNDIIELGQLSVEFQNQGIAILREMFETDGVLKPCYRIMLSVPYQQKLYDARASDSLEALTTVGSDTPLPDPIGSTRGPPLLRGHRRMQHAVGCSR